MTETYTFGWPDRVDRQIADLKQAIEAIEGMLQMKATPQPIVQTEPRHRICAQFDAFLDAVLADQDTGDSHAAEAMRLEFGESVTASVMQAAGVRRIRKRHEKSTEGVGTQKPTGAPTT